MLGTGLGSIVRVLHKRGYDPHFTLVEKNSTILQWAMDFFRYGSPDAKVEPVCADAMAYMEINTTKYDLIFVDVFMGRVVPDFVTSPGFLKSCRDSLSPGGRLAFNYIINDNDKWESTKQIFSETFPRHEIVDYRINRVFITA